MKKTVKGKTTILPAKLPCLLMLSLLMNGCSYHDGKFSYFDLQYDKQRTLHKKQAAEKFWASVRPKSNLSDAHYRLGLHYQLMGEHDKAIGEFSKAVRNDKNYCKAFNGIAMTYDLLKHCEAAHDSYEQAIHCDPGEAYVYNNYACSSLLCGNYGQGIELLQKAENLAVNDTRIKNNLRIARNIAIRENLSGYLMSENSPQPAATGAPSITAYETALPVLAPTISDTLGLVSSQDATAMPSFNPPASESFTSESSVQEVSPVAQVEVTAIPPVENKDKTTVSTPAILLPAPVKVAIEVSNGNGTTGMAQRSADFLRGHGFTVRSVTNASHFRFQDTVIYYKVEHLQAAKDLAAVIPGVQNLEKVESMTKSSIGVRVLLGRDLVSMRFPEDHSGLADYPQSKQHQPAVVTASNDMVYY